MTLKREVVSELGANDQVKYYFALLQAARANADRPQVPPPDLKAERTACEIGEHWLDDVVASARKDESGFYRVAQGPDLLRRIRSAIATTLECLPETERAPFLARLAKLDVPAQGDGTIPGELIAAITSGDREAGDSLHGCPRELGMVCIVGCEGLAIGPSGCNGIFGAQTIEEGEVLSVDGDKGDIYRGEIEVVRTRPTALLDKIAHWRAIEAAR